MSESSLWERAASCYEMAGAAAEAARCYQRGRLYRRAADLYTFLGRHHAAAEAYAAAGLPDDAAWRLVHLAGDVAAARALLGGAEEPADQPVARLIRQLVLSRCDLADAPGAANGHGAPASMLSVLTQVQDLLASDLTPLDPRVTEWSVALATVARRFDQVSLVYAAAVRGGRPDAAHRWRSWMSAHFGATIVIPEPAGRSR